LTSSIASSSSVASFCSTIRSGRQHGCREPVGPVALEQLGERRGVQQRHVAVQHEHLAGEVGRQRLDGLLDGAARAGDLVLVDDDRAGQFGLDRPGDEVALVPHDGDDVRGVERTCGGEHVRDDRRPRERVQDLRHGRLHAGPLTRGEHDDGEVVVHAPPPGFEPGPHSSKGCRAAVTPWRTARGGVRRAPTKSATRHPVALNGCRERGPARTAGAILAA
jgi:hypothetical protein